jgi:hypothetical protein
MKPARALPWLVATALCLGLSSPAAAHHGRDFLLVQTAELPHPGELYLIPRQDYIDAGEDEEIELEPTLLYGLGKRVAFELHAHIAKEGSESFTYESTAPAVHLRLTPDSAAWSLGLSAEYELSHSDEGEDVAEGRVILSRSGDGWRLGFNLIAEEVQESGAEVEWHYAAGFRHALGERVGLGIEVEGSFDEDALEALLGVYFEPSRKLSVNLGFGTGVGDEALDFSLRTALVWHLR